jgi:hypothetical protein
MQYVWFPNLLRFQDLVVQVLAHVFIQDLVVQVLVNVCPCCICQDLVVQVLVYVLFSKIWLSKFWFVAFFQDLVVQVLVHVFFPRLGCPSFGLLFVQLIVQVLVPVFFFPRLGCPSFGLLFVQLIVQVLVPVFFQDLVVQVLVCCIIVQLIVQVLVFVFAKTWLSKFWFVVLARLGCSSFGLLFVQDLFFVVGSFFPGLGCGSFSKSLSLSPAPSRRFEHQAEDTFFCFPSFG